MAEEGNEDDDNEDNSDEVEVTIDEHSYKALLISKNHKVSATIKILKVNENVFCVDYALKEGDSLDSLKLFKKIKN